MATTTPDTRGLARRSMVHVEWLRHHGLTWPFNLTGHPAASVPVGPTDDGHPVAVQIVGRRYEDDTVLAASAAIERERRGTTTIPRSVPDRPEKTPKRVPITDRHTMTTPQEAIETAETAFEPNVDTHDAESTARRYTADGLRTHVDGERHPHRDSRNSSVAATG